MPEFAWEAIVQLQKLQNLEIEVIMPVPQRRLRNLQSILRKSKGARAWPEDLDHTLLALKPKPTLIPYLPVPHRSIESAVAAISVALIARSKDQRPRLLHGSFLDEGGFAAAQVAQVIGCSSIAVAHGSDVKAAQTKGPRGQRSRTCLHKASEIVSVSEHLAQDIAMLGREAHVFPFTADGQRFELAELAPREGFNFLFVGRLEREKGIDLLLSAFSQLNFAKKHLTLVGPQVATFDLEAELRRLGIAAQTEYLGECKHADLQPIYANSDCLVLPSRSEGLGCVLVESLLVGRPLIASRLGGIPEILSTDVGILLEDLSIEVLREAMEEMIKRQKQAYFVPAELRARILPKTWRHVAPKLEALSRQLLQCEFSS